MESVPRLNQTAQAAIEAVREALRHSVHPMVAGDPSSPPTGGPSAFERTVLAALENLDARLTKLESQEAA